MTDPLDFPALAAEQIALAARFRAAAAKPENRKFRRLARRQAADAEHAAALFVRCARASTVEELQILLLRVQKLMARIIDRSNRILGSVCE